MKPGCETACSLTARASFSAKIQDGCELLSGSLCSLLLSLTCADVSVACLCHCLTAGTFVHGRIQRQGLLLRGVVGLQMGEKDLQEEDTKQYVANLLNQQIEHPDFQLTPDQVL